MLLCFCVLAGHLLSTGPYSKHAAALAPNPRLQHAVASLLLHRCLPALATAAAAGAAARPRQMLVGGYSQPLGALNALLASPSLQPAVEQQLQQAGGATAAQHVAAIVRALAACRPEGVPAPAFANALASAMGLLGVASRALSTNALLAEFMDRILGDSAGETDPNFVASACVNTAHGSGRIVAHALVMRPRQCPPEEQRAAAWQVVHLVPHAAAMLRSLAADNEQPREVLHSVCRNFNGGLMLLENLQGCPAQPAQLQAWAAAAEAGLRLQPLLADPAWHLAQPEADHPWHSSEAMHYPDAVSNLSNLLLKHLWLEPPLSSASTGGTAAAISASTARQLWQLHSTGCRLLHWLAADSDRQLSAAELGWAGCLRQLLFGADRVFQLAHGCLTPAEEGHQESDNQSR